MRVVYLYTLKELEEIYGYGNVCIYSNLGVSATGKEGTFIVMKEYMGKIMKVEKKILDVYFTFDYNGYGINKLFVKEL